MTPPGGEAWSFEYVLYLEKGVFCYYCRVYECLMQRQLIGRCLRHMLVGSDAWNKCRLMKI